MQNAKVVEGGKCRVYKFIYLNLNIVSVRRVPPHFTIQPDTKYEVNKGSNLSITCVAVGSPMPFVKWREGVQDITPENDVPIGKLTTYSMGGGVKSHIF